MGKATPARAAYLAQKRHARDRGIEWLFTFEEWVVWWKQKLGANWLKLRGRHRGQYVMARYKDCGPYYSSNVKCELHEINSVEGLIGKPKSDVTIERISKANTGKKHTTETKLKLSLIKRGRPWSPIRRARHDAMYKRK